MASEETETLVVGSGGSGLIAAAGLLRAGVSCRVIEKHSSPFSGSRGKGLLPRALEMLDNLGVLDAIRAKAEWCEGAPLTSLFSNHEFIGAMRAMGPPRPDRPYLATAIVPQWHTEAVLRSLLSEYGVHVEWSTELIDFVQHDDAVVSTVRGPDGETRSIHSAYLVGGDGARSTVRRQLGIDYVGGVIPDAHWLVGDVALDGLEHPEPTTGANGYCWLSHQGALFLRRFPAGAVSGDLGDNAWQFQAQIQTNARGQLPTPTLEGVQRIINERTGRTDIQVRSHGAWLNNFSVKVGYAPRVRDRRVFLAGEAAHVQSGGGLCSAIYDSSNLSWKLAAALRGSPDRLLSTYEAERGQSAREEIEATRALMYQATGLASQARAGSEPKADQMLSALNDPRMNDQMSGLNLHYRTSPLSVTWSPPAADGAVDTRGRSVVAGDRAPDAPCQDSSSGRTVRLFEQFRGPHWTVLGFGVDAARMIDAINVPSFVDIKACRVMRASDPDAGGALIDTGGHARQAFDVDDGAVVLVRPDNYIGMIAHADPRALETYFEHLRTEPSSQA